MIEHLAHQDIWPAVATAGEQPLQNSVVIWQFAVEKYNLIDEL